MGIYRGIVCGCCHRVYALRRVCRRGQSERMTLSEIIIALLIGGVMGFLFMMMLATIPDPSPRIVSPEIKARMAFHGTQVVLEDHKGNLFFYDKKGRKCKL